MADIALRPMAANSQNQVNGFVSVASPSRAPTLESGQRNTGSQRGPSGRRALPTSAQQLRQWVQTQFKNENIGVPDDKAEKLIKEAILRCPRSSDRKLLKHVLSDYAWSKNAPGYRVALDLIQTWLLYDGTERDNIKSQFDVFSVQPQATLSKVADKLLTHMSKRHPNSVRVIAIAERADPAYDHFFLTSRHKIWATLRTRLRDLPFVPGRVINILVKDTFGLPFDLHKFAFPGNLDAPRKTFNLPSKEHPVANFDPDQSADYRIVLTWERHAPHFESDIDIYMREPHRTLLSSCRAELQLWQLASESPPTNEQLILISFNHYSSLRSFTRTRNEYIQNQAGSSSQGQVWCLESEILLSIYALLDTLVSDTISFFGECSAELERMKIKARLSPTSNKLRYLLHLNDHRKLASAGVERSARILHAIGKWKGTRSDASQIWDAGLKWSKRAARLSNDLSFLRKQLRNMEAEIKEIQKLLREHMELTHDRRNFLLTLVAAVYLPLSFATSFFGMNIDTATLPSAQGFSNYTSDWIANSPIDYQNATRALASTIGTSGTLTFSWKTFGITAGCLLLTLPLSLTLGSIVRRLYQSMTYYARYWRMVALPSITVVFVLSVFGQGIPDMVTPSAICTSLFTQYVLMETYLAWRKQAVGDRTAKPLYWTLVLLVTSGCCLMQYYLIGGSIFGTGPLFLLPWTLVGWPWIVSYLKERRIRRSTLLQA